MISPLSTMTQQDTSATIRSQVSLKDWTCFTSFVHQLHSSETQHNATEPAEIRVVSVQTSRQTGGQSTWQSSAHRPASDAEANPAPPPSSSSDQTTHTQPLSLYTWCTAVSVTFKYDEPEVENVTRAHRPSATFWGTCAGTLPGPSNSEVMTWWHYTNTFTTIIIINRYSPYSNVAQTTVLHLFRRITNHWNMTFQIKNNFHND